MWYLYTILRNCFGNSGLEQRNIEGDSPEPKEYLMGDEAVSENQKRSKQAKKWDTMTNFFVNERAVPWQDKRAET